MSAQAICCLSDIPPNSGRAALLLTPQGHKVQVALFRVLTDEGEHVFAIDNYCPFAGANVLSRGIVGSLQGRVVVASPVYKQHFDLHSGQCLEDESVAVNTWPVKRQGDALFIADAPEGQG